MISILNLYIQFVMMMVLFSLLTIEYSSGHWTILNLQSLISQHIGCRTYESNDSNLQIDYPSDWTASEHSSNNIEFRPPTADTTLSGAPIVKMRIIHLPS